MHRLRLAVRKLGHRAWAADIHDRDDPRPLTTIRVLGLGDAAEMGFLLRALGHEVEVVRLLEVEEKEV